MTKRQLLTVVQTSEKMDRARELTDKLLQRQEEHERAEKEKMERVFA